MLIEVVLQISYRLSWKAPIPYGMRGTDQDGLSIGFVPGFRGVSRTGVEYSTNRFGFRDDPVDDTRDHVLFLGDSTAFGLNIAFEDSWPESTERMLGARGFNVQSINSASPGQGTISQLRVLDSLIEHPKLNINCMVLGFFHNDFSNNIWHLSYLEQRPPHTPTAPSAREITPISKQSFPFKSRLRMEVKALIRQWRGDYKTLDDAVTFEEATSRGLVSAGNEYIPRPGREVEWDWLDRESLLSNRAFRATIQALEEIFEIAEARNIPLLIVLMPSGEEQILRGQWPLYAATMIEKLEESGRRVPVIDVIEVYRKYLASPGLPDQLPADFFSAQGDVAHPGPRASQLIAAAVSEYSVSGSAASAGSSFCSTIQQ